jgi:monoterpene epsilon-lactone hydrolase
MTHFISATRRHGYVFALAAASVLAFQTHSACAQSSPGALEVPAKTVQVPTDVSPQMQKIIGLPLRTNWNVLPKTGEEWKPIVDSAAAALGKNVPGMLERLHVKVEPTTIDGVRAFIVTPDVIPPQNRNRLLVHVHGGCYVLNPGMA